MWESRGGGFRRSPVRDAEIIAVGSELLTHDRIDTNSLFITEQLNALGVEVSRKVIVGDDRARLEAAVRDALENVEIVVLSGGLGPTEDDLTRDAVAAALGRSLIFSQEICGWIEERFRRFQRKMAENNKRQAYLVEGAEALPNPRGTAPGQWLDVDGRIVMLLPGPPGELKPMFIDQCVPRLLRHLPPQVDSHPILSRRGDGRIGSGSTDRAGVYEVCKSRNYDSFGSWRYSGPLAGARRDGGRGGGAVK